MTVKFPYLPPGKEIQYVPLENEFMSAAKVEAEFAADRQHPTGAVVVKDGEIIGRGCNYAFVGYFPFLIKTHGKWCIRRLFKVPSGKKYWACPGCIPSKNHAESRSVRDAVRNGYQKDGADVYLWGHWWCCEPCWNSMINGNIKNVYLLENSDQIFNR